MAHGIVYVRLMNSAEWQRIRAKQLHDSPNCEMCLKRRIVNDKNLVVHHIVEVETGRTVEEQRQLAFAESTYKRDAAGGLVYSKEGPPIRLSGNLMTLCRRCHNKLHAEKKSHSKQAHKEREKSRHEAWKAFQNGNVQSSIFEGAE